jgi:hypothetical protein
LPVLDSNAPSGKRLGALWGYVGDRDVAAYLYASTAKKCGQREGELGPEDMLNLRRGLVVADASNLFEKSFKREDLIECGCNMHARRRFVEALDRGDARAALPLAAYKKLYEIEAEIRDKDENAKLAARQARSKPVFDELVAWCLTYQRNEPPKSPLGDAVGYLLNHHEALGRFLQNGAVPMDNGIVERLHVRAALTRKNFLFAGSDAGGERAAIAYTILACCRLAEVNPVEYLRDVLPRLSRSVGLGEVANLLPARWKAACQPATVTTTSAEGSADATGTRGWLRPAASVNQEPTALGEAIRRRDTSPRCLGCSDPRAWSSSSSPQVDRIGSISSNARCRSAFRTAFAAKIASFATLLRSGFVMCFLGAGGSKFSVGEGEFS